ncbi:MAG: alpha/beta hydrolase family protein, partial [Planctomycetaceae bacterium]
GCGSRSATVAFFQQLAANPAQAGNLALQPPQSQLEGSDPNLRLQRQMEELVNYTQKLLRRSARVRDSLWNKVSRKSIQEWETTAEPYRQMVYDELIGRLPAPAMPLNPRTRLILEEPRYRAFEVVLDVYPDVIAGGILLLPKDLAKDERRPVVVCQHGLEGVPMDTISRTVEGFNYYSAFAHELANRGFITYAPQNPYRGRDRFRTLQRKSNPLKRSLFSYIIPQHERTLEFLKSLPNVDSNRIAFYGLSYGGKTAVRVPPFVKDYCLSICSADFNEWVVKNTTVYDGYSYVFTGEYEIFEWNMGHIANYAELSNLMAPRPFMVERGHDDGVAPDEWVAWEYAKVRRHYAKLGLSDRTEIEFFNGPHKINGVQTYDFLHRNLNWPKP